MMGAEPYWYFTQYEPDVSAALQKLRQREFEAGRYNLVIRHLEFPITPTSPAPGPKHPTIEDAFRDTDCDGTRSILDIERISDVPKTRPAVPPDIETLQAEFQAKLQQHLQSDRNGYVSESGTAAPLDSETLQALYQTAQPTREQIEENMDFFEQIDRGEAIYIVVYKDGKPDELFFAGYSFD
jgi:hypothetical protein